MTREQAADKLKKLKALAEKGVGGERQDARRLYEKIKSKYGISEEELKEPQQDQQEKQFDGDTLFQVATAATMLKAEQEECDACPGHYGQAECKECGTYGNIQRLSRRLERLSRKRKGERMFYSGYSCDKCGKAIEYRREPKEWLPSKIYLVEYARQNGWSVGKKVLCPECRKKH